MYWGNSKGVGMNYIWEIAIKACQSDIPKRELFFTQAKECSPYYEQSFIDLNKSIIEDRKIEINATYRFDQIYGRYLHDYFPDHIEFKRYFFDISIHFLCEIDFDMETTKESLILKCVEQEIEELAKSKYSIWNELTIEEKDIILPLMVKQFRVDSNIEIFKKSLQCFYKKSMFYQMKEEKNFLLIYLGIKKVQEEESKINLLIDLFLPLGFKTRLFWDKHFGVINIDETMVLAEIELF